MLTNRFVMQRRGGELFCYYTSIKERTTTTVTDSFSCRLFSLHLPPQIRKCTLLPGKISLLWLFPIHPVTLTTTANTGGSPAGGWEGQFTRAFGLPSQEGGPNTCVPTSHVDDCVAFIRPDGTLRCVWLLLPCSDLSEYGQNASPYKCLTLWLLFRSLWWNWAALILMKSVILLATPFLGFSLYLTRNSLHSFDKSFTTTHYVSSLYWHKINSLILSHSFTISLSFSLCDSIVFYFIIFVW